MRRFLNTMLVFFNASNNGRIQEMAKSILMPLAPGFEEIEALAVVDILRRASVEVTVAGTIDGPIEGKFGIKVLPDRLLEGVTSDPFDMIVLPGGSPGYKNLIDDDRVIELLRDFEGEGKYVAAICGSPTVLKAAGITNGRTVTCHPGVASEFGEGSGATHLDERVVVDGRMVTSKGPGTAIEFAYTLVEILVSEEAVARVNHEVLARI